MLAVSGSTYLAGGGRSSDGSDSVIGNDTGGEGESREGSEDDGGTHGEREWMCLESWRN